MSAETSVSGIATTPHQRKFFKTRFFDPTKYGKSNHRPSSSPCFVRGRDDCEATGVE